MPSVQSWAWFPLQRANQDTHSQTLLYKPEQPPGNEQTHNPDTHGHSCTNTHTEEPTDVCKHRDVAKAHASCPENSTGQASRQRDGFHVITAEGGAPLQLKQDAEGWVLGEQGKEGSHRGLSGTAKHSLGHSTLSGLAALGFSGGVTLHCIQASSFHDEGSDLGPLQWKQCLDHWTAREFPTLGLFQQRQCRGWGHLWGHGGCRQRLG